MLRALRLSPIALSLLWVGCGSPGGCGGVDPTQAAKQGVDQQNARNHAGHPKDGSGHADATPAVGHPDGNKALQSHRSDARGETIDSPTGARDSNGIASDKRMATEDATRRSSRVDGYARVNSDTGSGADGGGASGAGGGRAANASSSKRASAGEDSGGGGSASGASGGTPGAASSHASGLGRCSPAPPPLNRISLEPHGGNGNRTQVDSTPIVCDQNYCTQVMGASRRCCPLRPEGDPMRVVCEREVLGGDGPAWDFTGNGSVEPGAQGNPFLAFAYGTGTVRACGRRNGACGTMSIVNGNPSGAGTAGVAGGPGSGGGNGPITAPIGGPTPSTPPPSGPPIGGPPTNCPLKLASPDNLRAKIAIRQQASLYLDATFEFYYGTKDDGSAAGPCGRRWCDLGVDGGPYGLVCADALVGAPQWSSSAVDLSPGFKDNPYFAKVNGGHGQVKVCSQFYPGSCGTVDVP